MFNCVCECDYIIKSTGYFVGDTLSIFADAKPLKNCKDYLIVLTGDIPVNSGVLPVVVNINGVDVPVVDRIGNNVISSRLHRGQRLIAVYGAGDPHFLVKNLERGFGTYVVSPDAAEAAASLSAPVATTTKKASAKEA